MAQVPKISDYAIIGNCRSAALVSKFGSIDWCCLPEFHSPSIFSALLDGDNGGRFSISPVGEFSAEQSYLDDTNIVSTTFKTKDGQARILDAFVVQTEEEKNYSLFPDHEILRIIEILQGTMQFRMEYSPTIYYGKKKSDLIDHKKLGIKFSFRDDVFILLSTIDCLQVKENKCVIEFRLQQGEKEVFSLSSNSQGPAILPELKTTAMVRMENTINYWKSWIQDCQYEGIYKEQVRRSALVLKLLTHAPSGAIIAAPTTSLPEKFGGTRNWDYRYCWLRDASFTTRVLLKLGFKNEAHAYVNWIFHATQLTYPKLLVVYSVFGNTHLPEKQLSWLNGYARSKPIRIGNEAYSQLQLDLYGEVIDALYSYSTIANEFANRNKKFMLGLGNAICKLWNSTDNGIWEIRSSSVHHTHSKVMAWVGLDRLIKLAEKYNWKETAIIEYKKVKLVIEDQIEKRGFNRNLASYTREFDGDALDASSLVFSLVGFCSPRSPRMISTRRLIKEQLTSNNLLYRYLPQTDGITGSEGTFSICNFWLIENLARSGEISEAIQLFELMLKYASPSGLFSEEIDPFSHQLLGNYPQSFTHIGFINAAMSINEVIKEGSSYEY